MANILEFLRGVLTDAEIRGAFQADPTGFLQRTGFGDLTGEDVAEAIAVVRRSLPEPAAAALTAFEDDDDLAVHPQAGERELDAAARVLLDAVALVPTSARAADPQAAAPTPGPAHAAPAPPRPAPTAAAPERRPSNADVELPDLPSVTAFAETFSSILTETKARLTDVLRQAAQDADRIRADAEAEVTKARAEAAAEREAAREYLERTRAESDAVLERARATLDDASRQREELIEASRAETEAARREIDARRTELRDAERQLRERLSGIDSLFRTVLRDTDPTGDEPADDGEPAHGPYDHGSEPPA